jgi:hypothetical protein
VAVPANIAGIAAVAVSDGTADSAVVSAGAADFATVETVMAPPVPGMQKPPRWVGKRFRDRLAVVPRLKT